jgi:hypothetical protein
LDAAFPVVLIALVLPSLRDAGTVRAALIGGVVALATAPLLPAGVPVAPALAGLLAAGRPAGGRVMNLAAILVLAGGTYAFRVTGPLLRGRLRVSERVTRLLSVSASVLLVALVATAALTEGTRSPGGPGRPGCWWAVRRAPFLVIVIAAVATTAGLRLLGVH